MPTKNQLLQTRRIIPVLLLLGILSSAFSMGNLSAIVTAKPDGLSADLDEDASMWSVFTEGNPTWALNNVVSPSLDGRSLRCAITGGNPYSNVHCYRNLTADPTSKLFTLSMSFFYRPASTFNNNGGPSVVQALEFTMNKWNQGLRHEWALQWDNVDTGAPKWRYWGRETPGGPLKWVDLGIVGSLAGQQWHILTLEGEILAGKVHYKRFIIDGQEHPLDIIVSPASTNEPDKLAVGVQLDGNSTETPYEVFLDQVVFKVLKAWPPADFNGDGRTDISVFRPSNGVWYVKDQFGVQYGANGDIPVDGDYDGDGDTDVAVFRPSNGVWYVKDLFGVQYGANGDIPVPGDYDDDGDTDVAVFRPSNGVWYVKDQFSVQFGANGDIPVPGDYDGDGDTDVAVFRPSNGVWYVKDQFGVQFGANGDIPVPGDYDDDGDTDVAVFRPSNGVWYVKDQFGVQYGAPGDILVPGDYDGDGKTDVAVFRPSNGVWYVRNQFGVQYGANGDIPLPAR